MLPESSRTNMILGAEAWTWVSMGLSLISRHAAGARDVSRQKTTRQPVIIPYMMPRIRERVEKVDF
jgi:hypothetical protein